ncbi:thiamine phosphate synthase [Mangrovibacterium marinum]|uniref:Thiamine-phosphate pyrophosphorylase n=1 Tax=Mangrovibacterium marinum TaxID=1639118 RepID=A0A2T5BX23_9BACT|nr:thiamine phosphate synthase [Mangrovibacterium marinum]PTN04342.1 thiamine-phosphate pyrophosphorylase [Mangrovibacterium marinum]
MKLLVISHPDQFAHEAEVINQLFELGMQHFHLRKPNWSTEEIRNLLKSVQPTFFNRIIIHDHFQLAVEFGLGGIHFSAKTKNQMPQWRSFEGSRSTSCHSLEELHELPDQIDYAFLSPIFPSISKQGYHANFDFDELEKFLATYNKAEVIALGGIEAGKIQTCRQIGFNGIAVLGNIWQEGQTQRELTDRFRILQKQNGRQIRNDNKIRL